MKNCFDVIVGGGGLIGSIMALAVSELGLQVAKIDKMTQFKQAAADFDGRSYTLSLSSVRMLNNLDVWKDISKRSEPIFDIKLTDGIEGFGASPLHMHFDYREMDEGPLGYVIEDRFLRQGVAKVLKNQKSLYEYFGLTIEKQRNWGDQIEVTLNNGEILRTRLLIGADGRNSLIADSSGIKRVVHEYNQTSLVCAVSHEKEHNGEAHQFFMPSGPLAILPLNGKKSSIVWTVGSDMGQVFSKLTNEEFLNQLRIRFGDFRGNIFLEGKRYCFPLSLSYTKSIVSDRVALVGDAAHVLHPIAGQGLNLGMRDIASLVEIISDSKRIGEDFGSSLVLKRYQEWRSVDRASLGTVTHLVNKIFSNDKLVVRTVRDLGMATLNKSFFLKNFFIREASGLVGELPSLMKKN